MKTSRATLLDIALKSGAALALVSSLALAQAGHHEGVFGGVGSISGILLETSVHAALALDATQEAAWQQLQAAAVTLRTSLETSRQALRTVIDAELVKATPNLIVIENALESAHEADEGLISTFRQQAITFYSSLNATQQATVIAAFRAVLQQGLRPAHG